MNIKQRYCLEIAYDGREFCGWQKQHENLSIQEHLEECLSKILGAKIHLTGSGRTDSGVHALKQVAHFDCHKTIDSYSFLKAINGLSSHSILINTIKKVPDTFHARYSAKGKIYHYHVWTERFPSPFLKALRYHHKGKLDLTLLKKALPFFIGEHDFSSFSNSQNQGACKNNPVRNLYRLDMIEEEGGFRLEFEGNGFLYKMVRNITGTLLDISRGYTSLEDVKEIFEAKDRRKAGKAAPAHGLFLVDVFY
ncbi:MAG: tRNA pseudouridine(38-40) synthase TruA [Chlamydiales bacterium]|nr:tRNA pseudouridine(38-40) synthase TruA [Chlamydiales bacterium]NCF71838.1 tRNA pseudouridine(38-40) synthase TruA [Chlamydiales bacterium]